MYNTDLLEQVKRKCNITWEDDDTDARLDDIIKSAIPTMLHKLGISDPSFDFSQSGEDNDLFLSFCFYEWNHAANDFDLNYERMIAETRAKHEVEAYLESGEEA